jgi:hypothetical protein
MGLIARLTTWTEGSELSHTNLNAEFDNIHDEINGFLDENNFDPTAQLPDSILAPITSSGMVTDPALSESASGILRSQSGIDTTAGKVWKYDGTTATLADPTDPLLLDYFISVANGIAGEGNYQGVVAGTFTKGLKYLGTAGALVDNIDGLASGSWIIQIGFAPTTGKLVVMNPNGRSFGKKR